MKYLPLFVLMILLVSGFAACPENAPTPEKTPEVPEIVVINDGYLTDQNGDLILDDRKQTGTSLPVALEKSEESTRNGPDGSRVKVMNDGYGNQTITRYFYNHPLLSGVVMRISTIGKFEALIYTRDGLVKKITQPAGTFFETATADQITEYAGIDSLKTNDFARPPQAIDVSQAESAKNTGETQSNVPSASAEFPRQRVDGVETASQEFDPVKATVRQTESNRETPSETLGTYLSEYETSVKAAGPETKKSIRPGRANKRQ